MHLAAEPLGQRAAAHPRHRRQQREADAAQDARIGQAEMVQVDPVGREPGGQRQEAAEGDEVQERQAPGARLVGGRQQRAPDRVAREQFLAAALRDAARFVGAAPRARSWK